MPLTKTGLNLSGLQNITVPTFSFKNTSKELINDIPVRANQITGGWFGFVSLATLFAFLLWKLNVDQNSGGDYNYNTARSVGIASTICGIIGLYGLNLGYFSNFYHVTIFIVIAFISIIVVMKSAD